MRTLIIIAVFSFFSTSIFAQSNVSEILKGDWFVYKQVDQNSQSVNVNITLHFAENTVNFKVNKTDNLLSLNTSETTITMGSQVFQILSLSNEEMILKDPSNNTLYIERTEAEDY